MTGVDMPPGATARLKEARDAAVARGLSGDDIDRYVIVYLAIMADRFAGAVSSGFVRALQPGVEPRPLADEHVVE